MSFFDQIFNVFSRRRKLSTTPSASPLQIPKTFRNRVFLWCRDLFNGSRSSYGGGFGPGDRLDEFWRDIHGMLQKRHGRIQLSNATRGARSAADDALTFLYDCPGEEFLDFIEYIFRVQCFSGLALPEDQLVEEINDWFRADDLPFYLTKFVTKTHEVPAPPPFNGRSAYQTEILSYPQVVMKESEMMHAEVIAPALRLLRHPDFENANVEFLEALEDYRKGDFGDCLTKCGSAFESTLKIICQKKSWPYDKNDTAGTLVKNILPRLSLDSYFEQMLLNVATIRNRLSKSHGAGPAVKAVPRHVARYAVNTAASAILLVAEAAGYQ